MHSVVSWDISATGEAWSEINEELKGALDGYSWARPLKTVYVVKYDGREDWTELKNRLTEVAKSHSAEVNVLISPPMEGGRYNGWLPKSTWPKLRKRTE